MEKKFTSLILHFVSLIVIGGLLYYGYLLKGQVAEMEANEVVLTQQVSELQGKFEEAQGTLDEIAQVEEAAKMEAEDEKNKFRLIAPNGGETYCYGEPISITWEVPPEVDIVHIGLKHPVIESNVGAFPAVDELDGEVGRGSLEWDGSYVGGGNVSEGKVFKVRIFGRMQDNELVEDVSESVFAITREGCE